MKKSFITSGPDSDQRAYLRNCFPYLNPFPAIHSNFHLLFLLLMYFGNLWIELTTPVSAIGLAADRLCYRALPHFSKSACHLPSERAGRVCRTVLTSNSLG